MRRYFENTETGQVIAPELTGRLERITAKDLGELLGMPLRCITKAKYIDRACPQREKMLRDNYYLDEPRKRRR